MNNDPKLNLEYASGDRTYERRLSYYERMEVREIIDKLLKEVVIRPSNSPYASQIVLVKRKGKTRLCINYKALNNLTLRDNYPLPLIEDCIDYLFGKTIFSVLDLKSGFNQIPMAEGSIKYTSFVAPDGQYEYLRVPFGLKNGPSVFQRFINRIFSNLIFYMDDILIASADLKSHLEILWEVLIILRSHGLKLNLNKSRFGFNEIEYLGYGVTASEISLTGSHVKTITEYPVPKNRRQLHSCIGLFSYFRRFMPSFSKIAKPLLDLLKGDVPYDFTVRMLSKNFVHV